MAMAGHLLLLKRPGRLTLSSVCGTRTPRTECNSHASMALGAVAASQLDGRARLRQGVLPVGGSFKKRRGLGLGLGGLDVAVAALGDAESRGAEVSAADGVDEVDPEGNSSFPAEFKDLIVDRGDPPNLVLYAVGFCVVVLMRDVILQEIAGWGINFARLALYIVEGTTIGLGKLTNAAAEPVSFLMAVVSWAIMAVTDMYTLIVDGAPLRSLVETLFLSLAVLSIGDATTSEVRGSRSRLVGIAAAIGLASLFDIIPPPAVLLSLAFLTAFAKFIQKADLVTVIMPATVSFVTIAEPILQVIGFGVFLTVVVYANWRAARTSTGESTERSHVIKASAGEGSSFVFRAITASIFVSLAARLLYFRSVKWLVLRST